jgi:hypothetical protein
MKELWVVTEYILTEDKPNLGEVHNEGFYSSKEKAITAVYAYLRNDFEEQDIIDHVSMEVVEDDYISILTHCGEEYGMYDCRYEIEPINIDGDFGE